MDKTIEIIADYKLKDYLDYTFKNLLAKNSVKFILLLSVIFIISDVLYFLKILPNEEKISSFNIIMPILVLIIFPLLIFLVTKNVVKRESKQNVKTVIIFNSQFVTTKKEFSEIKKPWNNYKEITETNDCVLLKQNKNRIDFYPKRFFSAQQLVDLKELINSIEIKNKLK
jgi:hypothetical protein